MPVHNSDVAGKFNRVADLLEIDDANQYRVRAYRNAARTVNNLPRSVADMIEAEEDLSELPGIGDDLAGKIEEIVETGELEQLEELEEELPPELSQLMTLPGLGAKRVRQLYDRLRIENIDDLAAAARDEKVREVPGFGKKTEQKILDQIEKQAKPEQRTKLADVEQEVKPLVEYLERGKGVKKVVVAGSYRRCKETVGDIDILVTCKKGSDVSDRFVDYEDVEEVVSHGKTRCTVRMRSGLQVDLRIVAEVCYGAALYYFTGSKSHNIDVRKIAVRKKLKINEYGVFRGDDRVAGRTEEEVFEQVGLDYIEPELRESRGEIEAAREGKLPELVRLEDIRGNLHAHTKASDGKYSLEDMAEAARELGYEYLAVTDHTKNMAMTKGLDEKRLREQMEEIDKLNEKLDGFRVLKGSEVDILEDGSLDLDDSALKELDVVVCSIHTKFDLSSEKQTNRILRAMDNPCMHILGHPTGRLINQRDAYDVNIERIIDAAADRGCNLEHNAQPDLLDLTDVHCLLAKETGVMIAVSTDAHSTSELQFMKYGIHQARRGWLEADDVINTRSWSELQKLLQR